MKKWFKEVLEVLADLVDTIAGDIRGFTAAAAAAVIIILMIIGVIAVGITIWGVFAP